MADPCDSVALVPLAQSQPSSSHRHFEVLRAGVGPAVCRIGEQYLVQSLILGSLKVTINNE